MVDFNTVSLLLQEIPTVFKHVFIHHTLRIILMFKNFS